VTAVAVDLPEAVDVDEHHGGRTARRVVLHEGLDQLVEEVPAIGQAGERVEVLHPSGSGIAAGRMRTHRHRP
jgi:hypothetical protein